MKSKILFLGSKPIGYFCLEHLLLHKEEYDIEIIGVLTNNTNRLGVADLKVLADQYDVPVINDLDDIFMFEYDYLISVQYHKILKKNHLTSARDMSVNLHMAPLPEYRGCNQFTFAIIDDKKEFGTTLHKMTEGIDDGDILAERRFPIPENCFVNELYDLTFKASCELFEQEIGNLFKNSFKAIPQSNYLNTRTSSIHYRKEINDVKKIDLNWNEDKIWRHIRATSMPGFPPPFTQINGIKLNFNIEI